MSPITIRTGPLQLEGVFTGGGGGGEGVHRMSNTDL